MRLWGAFVDDGGVAAFFYGPLVDDGFCVGIACVVRRLACRSEFGSGLEEGNSVASAAPVLRPVRLRSGQSGGPCGRGLCGPVETGPF